MELRSLALWADYDGRTGMLRVRGGVGRGQNRTTVSGRSVVRCFTWRGSSEPQFAVMNIRPSSLSMTRFTPVRLLMSQWGLIGTDCIVDTTVGIGPVKEAA